MKSKDQIRRGDAVEVERLRRPSPLSPVVLREGDAPPKAEPIREWIPATVVYADREQVAVAFSDGERTAIPRHSRSWRPA